MIIKKLINIINKTYFLDSFKYFFRKKYLNDFKSSGYFKKKKYKLNNIQAAILGSLKQNGYAKSTLKELFDSENYLKYFLNRVQTMKSTKRFQEAKLFFENNYSKAGKHYMFRNLDDNDFLLDPDDLLLKFPLSNEILPIINSYYKILTKIQTADIWITFNSNRKLSRTNAQKWHRDRDDLKVIKVFLYLCDIDSSNGATEYIPDSNRGKKLSNLAKFSYGNIDSRDVYPDQDLIDKKVLKDDIITLSGKAGTIFFVETTGLHRGGFAMSGERIFGYWSFVTPASLYSKKYFNLIDKKNRIKDLDFDKSFCLQ